MGSSIMRPKALLLDVDNTLYDWIGFFGPALRGMCSRLSELSGISVARLYSDFKSVFCEHGTVEYSFALQELRSLRELHPTIRGADLVDRYLDAIRVFQFRRRIHLRTYPGVRDGLSQLRRAGLRIYAVTDANRFQIIMRLRQLRLDKLMDGVCSVQDHQMVDEQELARIRRDPNREYGVAIGQDLILPDGLRKPNPDVLRWLLEELDVGPAEVVYVGDSLAKDIRMAQESDVYDCWAAYGIRFSSVDMHTLVRVTDWPLEAVQAALSATPQSLGIFPSFIARSFKDVVEVATTSPMHRPSRERWRGASTQLPLFDLGASAGTGP